MGAGRRRLGVPVTPPVPVTLDRQLGQRGEHPDCAVPGYSVTFTAPAGGTRIDIRTEMAVVLRPAPTRRCSLRIRVDSTVVAGPAMQRQHRAPGGCLTAGANNVTAAAGTRTVQVYLARQSAGSTGDIFATATEPAWLEVIDRG